MLYLTIKNEWLSRDLIIAGCYTLSVTGYMGL